MFPRYLVVLFFFTLGNASDAFLILRAQDLGVSMTSIPLLWGGFHISKMVWNVPGGMLSDRFRPMPLILAGWIVYTVVYAGFGLATSPWHAFITWMLLAVFEGINEAAIQTIFIKEPLRSCGVSRLVHKR